MEAVWPHSSLVLRRNERSLQLLGRNPGHILDPSHEPSIRLCGPLHCIWCPVSHLALRADTMPTHRMRGASVLGI